MTEPTVDLDNLPDDFIQRILRNRGGCRCGDPGARPPCWACSEPVTADEVMEADQSLHEERLERAERARLECERQLRDALEAEEASQRATW